MTRLVLFCLLALRLNAATVREHGAKGDGVAKDTAAIQRALYAAAAQGGGTITVPAGRYLSGTVHLHERVR